MMRSFFVLSVALSITAASAAAQDKTIRPGGATTAALHARQCETTDIEMVDARPVASPDAGAISNDYLEDVAEDVFFYFAPPEAKNPRYTIVRLVAYSDGSVSGMDVVESSRNDYFDRYVKQAIEEAGRARVFRPFPEEVRSDSLLLELSFGRHAGESKKYFAERKVCSAWPRLRNPTPEYPAELQNQGITGFVRAHFMVDADGHVKANTFRVLQATNRRFAAAVEAVLPELRYMPAEVQGRKVEQLTEQVFTFGLADRRHP